VPDRCLHKVEAQLMFNKYLLLCTTFPSKSRIAFSQVPTPDLQHKPCSSLRSLILQPVRNILPRHLISSFIQSRLTLLQIAKISVSGSSLELVVLRRCSPLSALAASKCKKYISPNLNRVVKNCEGERWLVVWWGWKWGSVTESGQGARCAGRVLDWAYLFSVCQKL
jgi:hypothetical protein